MTSTSDIIAALEEWFGEQYYDNLVDAIRWLIYNRKDIDKEYCMQWLDTHNEELREPDKYDKIVEACEIINGKVFKENVRKVKE
ncbi:MAG: hypothetical protein KBT06_10675 [Prevotellaceae bacterium]|nr:hypothetical protein [Candidatus Colivivens equi]